MPRIGFLATYDRPSANDNVSRLPQAFERAGWQVARLCHESLAYDTTGGITARDTGGSAVRLDGFDLLWLIGFGPQQTFLDRMQMLRALPQEKFINAVDALVYAHGKTHLLLADSGLAPESYVSNDVTRLLAAIDTGGEWIAKPTAASFGRNVFRVDRSDPNCLAILDSLTADGQFYCLLQRYIPDAQEREKRVLLAGDDVVGVYQKRKNNADPRGNLRAGMVPQASELDAEEKALVQRVGLYLSTMQIHFTAIDLVSPYVLEVNVANPGGLATVETLTGVDPTPNVVTAIGRYARAAGAGR